MYPRSKKAFTLAEVMLVVAILSFILAIALPSFFRSRELSRQRACQENLQKMDGAKQQWSLENTIAATVVPEWSNLVGAASYIRKSPVCPGGGEYSLNALADDPSCSESAQNFFPHTFEVSVTSP